MPEEKVKNIIYKLIVEQSHAITPEDTGYMLESVKLPEVRDSLFTFFKGITQ